MDNLESLIPQMCMRTVGLSTRNKPLAPKKDVVFIRDLTYTVEEMILV